MAYNELQGSQKNDPSWLKIALKEIGEKEKEGNSDNSRIVEYLNTTTFDHSEIKDKDNVAWCSGFANWCVKKAGYAGTNLANARSWENWGSKTKLPTRGCIVVFHRKGKDSGFGHVGFYMGETESKKSLIVLGGNQGNEVKIWHYSKAQLLGYRILATRLEKGSKYGDVTTLQKFLKKEGVDIGSSGADGDFGKDTVKAVKFYQDKKGFKKTGKVDVKYDGKKPVFIFGINDESTSVDNNPSSTDDSPGYMFSSD